MRRWSGGCGAAQGREGLGGAFEAGADLGLVVDTGLHFGGVTKLVFADFAGGGFVVRLVGDGGGQGRIDLGAFEGLVGRGGVVFGDVADRFAAVEGEADAAGIFHGDVEGAENQCGALQIDGIAQERVHDLHERDLDGLFVLDEGDGMETRLGRGANAAMHALMEVAELLAAKRRRFAAGAAGLNVSAGTGRFG